MLTTIILCGIAFFVGNLCGKNPDFFKEYKYSLREKVSKKKKRKVPKVKSEKKNSSDVSNIVSMDTFKKRKK